jgi:hypothetical protein
LQFEKAMVHIILRKIWKPLKYYPREAYTFFATPTSPNISSAPARVYFLGEEGATLRVAKGALYP